MRIKMPIVCGICTHPHLFRQVDNAIRNKDFPLELDCSGTSFLTSMFHKFAKEVYNRVSSVGGYVVFVNASGAVREAIIISGLDKYIKLV